MPQAFLPEKRQEWEDRICKQKESGLSIERWCRENQITPHSFHYWRKRLYPTNSNLTRSNFTEISNTKSTLSKNTGISIEYRGIYIHIDKHFDFAALKNCLLALREITC